MLNTKNSTAQNSAVRSLEQVNRGPGLVDVPFMVALLFMNRVELELPRCCEKRYQGVHIASETQKSN